MKTEEQVKMNLKESTAIIALVFISVFVFGFPHLIRFLNFGKIFPGDLPYFYASNTFYSFIINLLPSPYGQFIVPFAASLISVILFYFVLKGMNFGLELRFVASLFLVISPAMIYTAVISTPLSLFLVLLLLAFRLVLSENKIINLTGFSLFFVCCLFGFAEGLVVFTVIFFYAFLSKRLVHESIFFGILSLASASYFVIRPAIDSLPSVLSSFFSDLGGLYGFSLFAIILAVVGINFSWIVKHRFAYLYLACLSLILLSLFFDSRVNVVLNLLVVFFAAFAFLRFINRDWFVPKIKFWVLIILLLGLLFSTISYVERVSNLPPSKDLVSALEWISTNSNEESIIFSTPNEGFWIDYYANRTAFDNLFSAHKNVTDALLSSRNLDNTKALLNENDISYILIDKNNVQKNLYFLFSDNSTFMKVHESSDYEVWFVIN